MESILARYRAEEGEHTEERDTQEQLRRIVDDMQEEARVCMRERRESVCVVVQLVLW